MTHLHSAPLCVVTGPTPFGLFSLRQQLQEPSRKRQQLPPASFSQAEAATGTGSCGYWLVPASDACMWVLSEPKMCFRLQCTFVVLPGGLC